jgi:molybdate transport system ATP-binding protein
MSEAPMIRARFRGARGGFHLDASFETPARGVTALYGPSGCGKTSLLRAIAGLDRIEDGFCTIGDDIWQNANAFTPVHKRELGYVFQEPSLFPHLSVRDNLLFGARQRGSSAASIAYEEVIELLGLHALLTRAPQHLSGGERQRVAIGRALLAQPRLLLMDEPLAALDKISKDDILPFLERLHETLSLPVLYVSHDMSEIERLADQLVLMQAGQVLAAGSIGDLQSNPDLPLIAARDAAVSLDGTVQAYDTTYGLATVMVAGGEFLVPMGKADVGERRRLRILAGDVSLALEVAHQSTIVNILRARILSVQATGDYQMTAILGLGPEGQGAHVLARVTRRSWDLLGLRTGMVVHAQIKGVALVRRRNAAP